MGNGLKLTIKGHRVRGEADRPSFEDGVRTKAGNVSYRFTVQGSERMLLTGRATAARCLYRSTV